MEFRWVNRGKIGLILVNWVPSSQPILSQHLLNWINIKWNHVMENLKRSLSFLCEINFISNTTSQPLSLSYSKRREHLNCLFQSDTHNFFLNDSLWYCPTQYYRLNVCVLPKFIWWNLISHMMVFEGGGRGSHKVRRAVPT